MAPCIQLYPCFPQTIHWMRVHENSPHLGLDQTILSPYRSSRFPLLHLPNHWQISHLYIPNLSILYRLSLRQSVHVFHRMGKFLRIRRPLCTWFCYVRCPAYFNLGIKLTRCWLKLYRWLNRPINSAISENTSSTNNCCQNESGPVRRYVSHWWDPLWKIMCLNL